MVRRLCMVFLIGVLAVVQGAAPLMHAHAGGPGAPAGVHMDGVARMFAAPAPASEQPDGASASVLMPEEGAAVGLGPKLRDRFLAPAIPSSRISQFAVASPDAAVPYPPARAESFPSHAGLRPPAQAPPRFPPV